MIKFATEVKSRLDEPPPVLFHRVAELWSQLRCQSIAESGRLPSAALPARKRLAASCAEERLRSAAPFNTNLPRLVDSLSTKRSLNLSFDEAAKVESLLKGISDSQSWAFWLFSALSHWLKEFNFVPPNAFLIAHLIQNLLLALVNASSSSASLAAYVQAKRREGVLSHFPSHVGIHFRKDLAASSFAGPFLFDDEVLARIIASSREDSHLDAQLSIAKAFKLPVFWGAGNADRKASSNQRSEASPSSSSVPRGRGGSNLEDKGAKLKAPPSPRKGRSYKAPRHSASPGKGKRNFRK